MVAIPVAQAFTIAVFIRQEQATDGLAIFLVAVGEVGAGAAVIIGGFLGGAGHLVTRLAGGAVLVIMTGAFYLAHADWFITQKLFMSEQIFIFALGLYFAIKGNN